MSSVETSPGLGGGDWLVIVFYLAAVIGLGVWLGRGQRNTRDYFLGGRDLPWWCVALSILATETSALTFIGVPAMAYASDLGFMQIVLGYAVGRVILAVVMCRTIFGTRFIHRTRCLVGRSVPRPKNWVRCFFWWPGRWVRGYAFSSPASHCS